MYDLSSVRREFPVLAREINGKRNTFLDTAASAQKPKVVIDSMQKIYLR